MRGWLPAIEQETKPWCITIKFKKKTARNCVTAHESAEFLSNTKIKYLF